MEFTGERFIPELIDHNSMPEDHFSRYFFAGKFVSGQRVLDLGCGTGYGTYHLSQQGARFVLGVDVDGSAVQYAHLHYKAPNLAFAQADASYLPLRQKRFDVVVSFEVIEHLPEVTNYLGGIGDLLTDEGWLIGSTPNKLLSSPDRNHPHNPFHCREYDPAQLESLLKDTFEGVVILGQRPFHGLVISAVPMPQNADLSVELLPANESMETSVAESMFLVYLASKTQTWINVDTLKTLLDRPHYYLGRPASYHTMLIATQIRNLEAQRDRLEELVRGYQSGKFIRFMNVVHRWKSRLLGS